MGKLVQIRFWSQAGAEDLFFGGGGYGFISKTHDRLVRVFLKILVSRYSFNYSFAEKPSFLLIIFTVMRADSRWDSQQLSSYGPVNF